MTFNASAFAQAAAAPGFDEAPPDGIGTAFIIKRCQVRRNKVDHLVRVMGSQLELNGSCIKYFLEFGASFGSICQEEVWYQRRWFTNRAYYTPTLYRYLDLLWWNATYLLGEPQLHRKK